MLPFGLWAVKSDQMTEIPRELSDARFVEAKLFTVNPQHVDFKGSYSSWMAGEAVMNQLLTSPVWHRQQTM